MIAILAALLLKVIIIFGIAFLAGLISHVAYLTAKALLTRIRDALSRKVGGRVFTGAVKKIAQEVEAEARRKNKVQNVQSLLKELEGEGVVIAEIAADGTVDDDSIEILKAEEIDTRLDQLLRENQYELIFEE